jgi:hypothetical protein
MRLEANRGVIAERRLVGPPDLVVEIASPSTAAYDRDAETGRRRPLGVAGGAAGHRRRPTRANGAFIFQLSFVAPLSYPIRLPGGCAALTAIWLAVHS